MLRNKRADFESVVYVVIFLVVIGMAIFTINHLNVEIFTELETHINDSGYEDTEAMTQAGKFLDSNTSNAWDYGFLAIFFGSLMAIALSAYAIRISPVFYWVYGILSIFVLGLGTILSNIWQELAADPTFATTLTRFPIMNTLLGTYYPLMVTVIIVVMMGILFGKPSGQGEGFI